MTCLTRPLPTSRLLRHTLAALALSSACVAQAATVHGLRSYFDSLAGVYAPQAASNPWTFHTGSHAGALLTAAADRFLGPVSPQQFGLLVNPGDLSCTAGFCGGVAPADTLASFAGVFVHSGTPDATVAVFHADAALQLDEIRLFSETVQNGHHGDGMTVQVRVVLGGIEQEIGSFLMNHALSASAAIETVYTPGLTLAAGDKVEVRYGPRGSYLYDHGNVNLFISTSAASGAPPAAAVPEPASAALAALGLLMTGLFGRAFRPAPGRRVRAAARRAPASSRV